MAIEQSFTIGGMTCAACVSRVEKVLGRVPGVLDAQVNLVTAKATIHSSSKIGLATLKAAVERAGYTASLPSQEAPQGEKLWPVLAGAVLTAPLLLTMLPGVPMLPGWAAAVLAGCVQIGLGSRFVHAGIGSIRAGSASMDVLVAHGSWGCVSAEPV